MGIYNYERRLHLVLDGPNGITQSEAISPENKEKLLEYSTYLKASGKSLPRQIKLIMTMKKLSVLLGSTSFRDATRRDMEALLAKFDDMKYRGKKPSPHTKKDFRKISKAMNSDVILQDREKDWG